MIAKFLDEPVKDDMKETTALDFRYGVKIKDERKQKVNIYELGKFIFHQLNFIRFRRRSHFTKSFAGTH